MTTIKNLSKASTIEIKALQKKELEILKYFKKVCVNNNLKFFLAGGTCIGAIRDGGFVSWDDDVDVFMLREDYEKLYKNWSVISNNPKYELCRSDSSHNYRHAAMTLNDSETTFINFRTANENVNQGIGIDILPMDFMPDKTVAKLRQRTAAILYSVYINQRLPDNQGKLLRKLTALPLSVVKDKKKRYRIWKKAEKRMINYSYYRKKYNVELVTGLKAILRPLDSRWFADVKYVKFEDTTMPVPIGYDKYLSLVFGNYMELPLEEQRVAKHHTVFIDTENSYKKYKGIYYLKDGKQ